MILSLILLMIIMLGLSFITIGAYLWLAAKKVIAGILLVAIGLIFTLVPIAFIAFFTITRSARG